MDNNKEIKDYLKQQLAAGKTEQFLRDSLKKANIPEKLLDEMLAEQELNKALASGNKEELKIKTKESNSSQPQNIQQTQTPTQQTQTTSNQTQPSTVQQPQTNQKSNSNTISLPELQKTISPTSTPKTEQIENQKLDKDINENKNTQKKKSKKRKIIYIIVLILMILAIIIVLLIILHRFFPEIQPVDIIKIILLNQ